MEEYMKKMLCAAVAVLVAALAGCGDKGGGVSQEELKERAIKLAEADIKRFEAIEEKYKDDVVFNQFSGNPFMPEMGVFLKVYRDFEGFEVQDIRLRDSLTEPVELEIAYKSTIMHTPYHEYEHAESPVKAAQDTEYEEGREDVFSKIYILDDEGEVSRTYFRNLAGEIEEEERALPERANYYSKEARKPRQVVF
jgi:hypothetical protein